MSLEGELQGLGLPRVMQSIAAQRSSGILTVQGEEDIVAVSFLQGGIVAADALNQTVEEGLGEVLQSRNLISSEDFAAAVKDHQGSGDGSLAELLVNRNLVSRADLLEGLRQQTYGLMLRILTWRQGELKFYSGDEISYEDGLVPISIEELLIRSIEDLGEKGGIAGPVPDLEAAYRRVPSRAKVLVLARDGDGTGDGIWISSEQEIFMSKVSAKTAASALTKEMGLDRYRALFTLYNLLHHDLIEHLGPPRSGAKVAPAKPAKEPMQAEIFMPPEPGAAGVAVPAAQAPPPSAPVQPSALVQRWIGPGLAVFFVVALTVLFLRSPGSYLFPFPWQDNLRGTVERQLRQTLFLRIDRAAKTYFLTQVHYPDTLGEMVALGLVSPAELRDQAGNALRYTTDDLSYRIVPFRDGGPLGELATTEAITGDFMLDPQFLRSALIDVPPLVLLD